jgi:hypothetical protein
VRLALWEALVALESSRDFVWAINHIEHLRKVKKFNYLCLCYSWSCVPASTQGCRLLRKFVRADQPLKKKKDRSVEVWKVVKRNSAIIDLCGSLDSRNREVGSRGDLNFGKQILTSHLVSLIFVHCLYLLCFRLCLLECACLWFAGACEPMNIL